MHGAYFSYGLHATLAIALVIAVSTDLRRREIDNWLNAAIALAAPLFWLAQGLSMGEVMWQLGQALVTFAIFTVIFALRGMGGGDVKLLTALALWFPGFDFMRLVVVMALLGGTISVIGAMRNVRHSDAPNLHQRVALVGAGLWVLISVYGLYVVIGGAPLPIGAWLNRSVASQLPGWVLTATMIVLLCMVCASVMHLARRQRGRLKIPYGVAISGAGLWVLASTYIAMIPARGITG